MTVIDAQVGAGADDGYWEEDGSPFNNTSNTCFVGIHFAAGTIRNSFYRFTGITMSGTIDIAYISLRANGLNGSGILTKVFGDDQSEPTAVSSEANGNSRTRTTAGVDWDPTVFTLGTWYDSPSIVSVIQELVNSYTFSSSALQILHDDDGTPGTLNYIKSYTYEQAAADAPKLHIEYTAGAAVKPKTLMTLGVG